VALQRDLLALTGKFQGKVLINCGGKMAMSGCGNAQTQHFRRTIRALLALDLL
jgi:hypothetical protein